MCYDMLEGYLSRYKDYVLKNKFSEWQERKLVY